MDEKQNLFKHVRTYIELTPSESEPFNMPSKDDALFILHFLIFIWHIKLLRSFFKKGIFKVHRHILHVFMFESKLLEG